MLESGGFVTSVEREGRRIYSITEGGLRFLAENEELGQAIEHRLRAWANPENAESRRRTMREFQRIADVIRFEIRRMDASRLDRVRGVLSRTHQEIQDILGE
jgi:DNA-binding PadR family transcriptional regulator